MLSGAQDWHLVRFAEDFFGCAAGGIMAERDV